MGTKDLSKFDAQLEAFGKSAEELERVAEKAASEGTRDLAEADEMLAALAEGVVIDLAHGNGASNWPEDDGTDQMDVPPAHAGSDVAELADEEFVLMVDDDAFEEVLDDDIEEIDLEADLVEHINSSKPPPPPKTTRDSFMKKLLRRKS